MKNLIKTLDRCLRWIDHKPLWLFGFLLFAVAFAPIAMLGEGCVFTWHDQLDESMMNYVLTARHLGQSEIPEMMGGIRASGITPSAILFLPLFLLLSPLKAFLTAYVFIFLCAFLGMYFLVKELTESNLLAVAIASCFAMLPYYVIYGLSQMGIPMVILGFLYLCRKKRILPALGMIALFGFCSHLVLTGYCVLGFAALLILYRLIRKEEIKHCLIGFFVLLGTYVISCFRLFQEILFGTGDFVSHRVETVSGSQPFFETVWSVLKEGSQHMYGYQGTLILPMIVMLVIGAFFLRGWEKERRIRYWIALGGFVILVGIAVFFGICKSEIVVRWKNSQTGFLRYFQMERFYWLYPAGWLLELAMIISCWWPIRKEGADEKGAEKEDAGRIVAGKEGEAGKAYGSRGKLWQSETILCVIFAGILLPVVIKIAANSFFYQNVNQYNNRTRPEITGYVTWEGYYSEDVMKQIDEKIGKDKTTYRVAHLGMNPGVSLMHGFYTVDGYSNNYSLEYKHKFRKVIAKELEKVPATASYFDDWGSRCYLFNSQSGTAYMLSKRDQVKYQGLEFDLDALKDLGCEYIFSAGEIRDAEQTGLKPLGYYESDTSYWGIWLYGLN